MSLTTYTPEELALILENHRKWRAGENGGSRAYLQGAYLQGANLQGANLQGAYLQGAYLQGANLRSADLQGADLRSAYLQGADLQGANLRSADLQRANLQGAYLQGAYLQGAYLQSANLRSANLQGAYLQGAYLQGAYLQGAYLRSANLQGADLKRADLRSADIQGANLEITEIIHKHSIVPESGAFTAFKKVHGCDGNRNVIVKLEIPASAKRLGGLVGRKCRVSKARVVSLTLIDGSPYKGDCHSRHDKKFKYTVGALVEVNDFCDDTRQECAAGIHMFLTRREAVEY